MDSLNRPFVSPLDPVDRLGQPVQWPAKDFIPGEMTHEIDVSGAETGQIAAFLPPAGMEEVERSCRLAVRCTPEALAWVRGLADHMALDATGLVWQSLLRMAETSGYYSKIPRRYRPKRVHPNRRPVAT